MLSPGIVKRVNQEDRTWMESFNQFVLENWVNGVHPTSTKNNKPRFKSLQDFCVFFQGIIIENILIDNNGNLDQCNHIIAHYYYFFFLLLMKGRQYVATTTEVQWVHETYFRIQNISQGNIKKCEINFSLSTLVLTQLTAQTFQQNNQAEAHLNHSSVAAELIY